MLVYGKNVCLEYLNKGDYKKVYLEKGFKDNNVLSKITGHIEYVDRRFLDQKCSGLHQGIMLEVSDFKYADLYDYVDFETSTIIILDHLEDPHNLGAIIRTSEAAGINAIVIPKDRSVDVNATVLKTSVGAAYNIPICQVTNINDTILKLKNHGFWIVGTDMDGEDFKKIDYRGKCAIVIGNEGKGISDLVRKNCDFVASIPMYGKVNSLNASVACGLMIYETVRQIRG